MYQLLKIKKDGTGGKEVGSYDTLQEAQFALIDQRGKHAHGKYRIQFIFAESDKEKKVKKPSPKRIAEGKETMAKIDDLDSCIISNDNRTKREDTLDDNCHEWAQLY